jgi:flagellar basal body-associated protein FliL
MYEWIVLLHVVGAFMFVASHGVAMWMVAELPRQKDPKRIQALLDLSSTSLTGVYVGLLLLLVGGIWAGIAAGHFGRLWIWLALIVLVAIIVLMYVVATPFFKRLRMALGVRTPGLAKDAPDPVPAADAEILAIAASTPAGILSAVGFGGLLIILWLMVVKPF